MSEVGGVEEFRALVGETNRSVGIAEPTDLSSFFDGAPVFFGYDRVSCCDVLMVGGRSHFARPLLLSGSVEQARPEWAALKEWANSVLREGAGYTR